MSFIIELYQSTMSSSKMRSHIKERGLVFDKQLFTYEFHFSRVVALLRDVVVSFSAKTINKLLHKDKKYLRASNDKLLFWNVIGSLSGYNFGDYSLKNSFIKNGSKSEVLKKLFFRFHDLYRNKFWDITVSEDHKASDFRFKPYEQDIMWFFREVPIHISKHEVYYFFENC